MESYYQHAIEFWKKIPNLSSDQLLDECDFVFRFINEKHTNSQIVYDVSQRILEEEVGGFSNKIQYIIACGLFIRPTLYLQRFYILQNNLKSLNEIAHETANNYF